MKNNTCQRYTERGDALFNHLRHLDGKRVVHDDGFALAPACNKFSVH